MKVKKVIFVLLLGLLISCNSSDESKEKSNQVVKEKPEVPKEYVEQATFTDFDGDTVAISKFKGKVVVIDFWETWCSPCIESFPTLQKLQEEYPESFTVLAVTPGFSDTQKEAQSFAENHEYNFKYLMDSNNLHKDLQVKRIPFKIFVDAQGKFIKKSMGSYGPENDYNRIKAIIEKYKNS